jgi:hypothetical protein
MSDRNRSTTHDRAERLRRILREADPAAGMEDLAPEEIAAMRRAMLNSLREERPAFAWRVPALAAATLAALALAGILWLRWNGSGGETQAAAPMHPAPLAPPAVRGPQAPRLAQAPEARQGTPALEPRPEPGSNAPQPTHRHSHSGPGELRAPPPPAATAVEAAVREVQFSTPGGTRIVWVFAQDDPSSSASPKNAPRPSRL